MLLSKTTTIKWNNKNRKYYESLGYVFTRNGDEFEVDVEHLTKASKAIVEVQCDYCGKVVNKAYQTYIKQHHEKHGDCCVDCQPIKNKLCCLDKYGVDNGAKTPEAIQKMKDTSMERYGVDNPSKSEAAREKISKSSKANSHVVKKKSAKTLKEKYGVSNAMYVPELKEKQRNTFYNNYGVFHPKQNEGVKARERQHNFEKYGYENVLQIPEVKQKIRKTCLEKYGVECVLSLDRVREKIAESYLQHGSVPTSKPQIDLYNLLLENYGNCELNYRCGRYLLDCMIMINDIKIDVEFDGKFWHQDKERDDKRDVYVLSKGYKVLRIVGDHYIPSLEQIKQSIDNLINSELTLARIELV